MTRPKAALLTGSTLLSLASLLAASGPAGSTAAREEGGTISGKITFNGEPPTGGRSSAWSRSGASAHRSRRARRAGSPSRANSARYVATSGPVPSGRRDGR